MKSSHPVDALLLHQHHAGCDTTNLDMMPTHHALNMHFQQPCTRATLCLLCRGSTPPGARPPFAIKARKKHIDIAYRIGGGRDVKDREGWAEDCALGCVISREYTQLRASLLERL